MAAYAPSLLQPLSAALPAFFRNHLDTLAHRGSRTHALHAPSGAQGTIHTIPISGSQVESQNHMRPQDKKVLPTAEDSIGILEGSEDHEGEGVETAPADFSTAQQQATSGNQKDTDEGDKGRGHVDVTMHDVTTTLPGAFDRL
jgi:hypothetical protein